MLHNRGEHELTHAHNFVGLHPLVLERGELTLKLL